MVALNEKIDLNKADKRELMQVLFLGEKKAEAILRYREQHGPFKSVEELDNIIDLSRRHVEAYKDWFTVETQEKAA